MSRTPSRSRSRSRSRDRDRDHGGRRGRAASHSHSPARDASPPPRSSKVWDIVDVLSVCVPAQSRHTDVLCMQIVVEKLTKNVTDAHLREIFSVYGTIQDLDMPMNRQCEAPLHCLALIIRPIIMTDSSAPSHDQPRHSLSPLQHPDRRRSGHRTHARGAARRRRYRRLHRPPPPSLLPLTAATPRPGTVRARARTLRHPRRTSATLPWPPGQCRTRTRPVPLAARPPLRPPRQRQRLVPAALAVAILVALALAAPQSQLEQKQGPSCQKLLVSLALQVAAAAKTEGSRWRVWIWWCEESGKSAVVFADWCREWRQEEEKPEL